MKHFVDEHSIVRRIWGNGDTILFIFAGASAEFALNKAVDWLYFTGRLPSDPLGRLFSTVSYARAIVFSEEQAAHKAIDTIAAIHAGVEANRGAKIPDWAYRDVLFMLIDYSIRSYEVLERKLGPGEKEEVFDVFFRVGARMGLKGLPNNFNEWVQMREGHLQEDMQYGHYTSDLYMQYRKHLGPVRYRLLLETQRLIAPAKVRQLLGLNQNLLLRPLLSLYKISRYVRLDRVMKEIILPQKYKQQIKLLDVAPQH